MLHTLGGPATAVIMGVKESGVVVVRGALVLSLPSGGFQAPVMDVCAMAQVQTECGVWQVTRPLVISRRHAIRSNFCPRRHMYSTQEGYFHP